MIADETYRKEAIALASELRAAGWRVLFPLSSERVGKQFSTAENAGAALGIVIGGEWPQLKVKRLSTREESEVPREGLVNWLKSLRDV